MIIPLINNFHKILTQNLPYFIKYDIKICAYNVLNYFSIFINLRINMIIEYIFTSYLVY